MFIPDSVVFLRQLRQAGLTMPVLSTDGNADAALLDAGAKAIDGLTFSNSVCTAEGDPGVRASTRTTTPRTARTRAPTWR